MSLSNFYPLGPYFGEESKHKKNIFMYYKNFNIYKVII